MMTFDCPRCGSNEASLLHQRSSSGATCLSDEQQLDVLRRLLREDASFALKLVSVRPEVARFAVAMEDKLRRNDHKTGWADTPGEELLSSLLYELRELVRSCPVERRTSAAIEKGFFERELKRAAEDAEGLYLVPNARTAEEALDVANFAMMIFDNALRSAK